MQKLQWHPQTSSQLLLLQQTYMTLVDTLPLPQFDFWYAHRGQHIQEMLRIHLQGGHTPGGERKHIMLKEGIQNILIAVAKRTQQHCGRQLAAPINTTPQQILRIKLKVQPGATIWNNPCRKEQLS